MSTAAKRIAKVALWGLAALFVVACGFVAHLAIIGDPGKSSSLRFEGFVLLHKGGLLNVLDYLAVSDQQLFVTGESSGDVYRINLHRDALPQSTDVTVFAAEPAAHGVALDASKRQGFVTRSEANVVDVFDPATMKPLTRIPVAEDADAILFDSMHNLIYVANGDAHLATLIDPKTRAVVSTIPLGGKPEFAVFDAQTGLMYQNLRDLNAVAAVDVAARSVKQLAQLPGCDAPSGMSLDGAQRRLFIVCAGNAMLAVFDLNARRVSSLIPIGGGPDSVAFDADSRRIYTTGKAGVLTVIQQDTADTYRVLDSIKLHYGAHTLVVDPATHLIYVAYASLLVPPRIAVFAPQP
jgi:YVTN family beta-propeller protein